MNDRTEAWVDRKRRFIECSQAFIEVVKYSVLEGSFLVLKSSICDEVTHSSSTQR